MLSELIRNKKDQLAVYFTAGFPELDSTAAVLKSLDAADVNLIELGLPFSDSLVDGPTIQMSNQAALENGMNLQLLLEQLAAAQPLETPVILMGSFNPIMQFGVEYFLKVAKQSGVSAVILPDLPPEEYEKHYQEKFEAAAIGACFLITSRSSEERIRYLDSLTTGFLYAVSSDAITGSQLEVNATQQEFFDRLSEMKLRNAYLIGFGIRDKATFQMACSNSNGAIIGSEFIRQIGESEDLSASIEEFVGGIRF